MKTKLIDFPMYSLDTSTGIVYHGDKPLRHYGENQGTQWKYFLKHGASGKMRTVSIGRLMATVKYGCNYYQLPKDIMFNWSAGDGLTMRTRQECGKMSYNTVLKREQSIDRIQVLERTQSELSLIKQGYQGNIEPLADYMYSKRKHYLHLVQRSRLSAGLGGGDIAGNNRR